MGFLDKFFKGSAKVPSYKKQLRNVLGFTPGSISLYQTALTHRSVRDAAAENNERLEYLGDAILSAIVADFLFKKYPYFEINLLNELSTYLETIFKLILLKIYCLPLKIKTGCRSFIFLFMLQQFSSLCSGSTID